MLPAVEFGKPLLLAFLNMAGHQAGRPGLILLHHCFDDALMVSMNSFQCRGVMPGSMNRKDPYQQPGIVYDFLNAHVCSQPQQKRMESQITGNEAAHLLFIELRSRSFLKLLLQGKYFVGKSLQPFMLLRAVAVARGLSDRINFQRLA